MMPCSLEATSMHFSSLHFITHLTPLFDVYTLHHFISLFFTSVSLTHFWALVTTFKKCRIVCSLEATFYHFSIRHFSPLHSRMTLHNFKPLGNTYHFTPLEACATSYHLAPLNTTWTPLDNPPTCNHLTPLEAHTTSYHFTPLETTCTPLDALRSAHTCNHLTALDCA